MTIRPLPEVVDFQGYRRRAWEFVHEGQLYIIQQTGGPLAVLRQMTDQSWQPLAETETVEIVAAFKAIHDAATGDFLE